MRLACQGGTSGNNRQSLATLTFPATQGLLWFLNVTLGFYLPQVMARNWADAFSPDEPVRGRVGGNGWDLYHAPINAIRVADARQEAFSFGMIFLDPEDYRVALEKLTAKQKLPAVDLQVRHLLLRTWSSYGYSRGRFWAAFSLWRGLGFIGQALELGWKEWGQLDQMPPKEDPKRRNYCAKLREKLHRLIRSHCLAGMVPGALLDRESDEQRLRQGFPRWEPDELEEGIDELAERLAEWLAECWNDRILPFPVGDVWIGWKDCFIRRIHGEYVLGSLWPRLKAAYLEEHGIKKDDDTGKTGSPRDRFFWKADVAAGAWSDIVVDYWRGCPPILRLLLTCPAFLNNRKYFERNAKLNRNDWLNHLSLTDKPREKVEETWNKLDRFPGLVSSEFEIKRVRIGDFATPPVQHHAIRVERTEIEIGESREGGKQTIIVESAPDDSAGDKS